MNSRFAKIGLRVSILVVVWLMVVHVWRVEAGIDLHGIPLGVIGLLLLFPTFLVWFLGFEIWRQKIAAATILIPLAFLSILELAVQFDKAAYSIRTGGPRMHISNDLKQIALAMLNYEAMHGSLPPASVRAPGGKPLLSWRVLILPYLEEERLFAQFRLDEPWDSPNNIALVDRVPGVFAGPNGIAAGAGLTHYQVLVGPGTAFEGNRKLRLPKDFPDGIASTILVAEARNAVPWTQPIDLPFDPAGPLTEMGALRGKSPPTVFMAAMVDGSVRAFHMDATAEAIRTWITRNGGEKPGEID